MGISSGEKCRHTHHVFLELCVHAPRTKSWLLALLKMLLYTVRHIKPD